MPLHNRHMQWLPQPSRPLPTRRAVRLAGMIKSFVNASEQDVTHYLGAKDLSMAPSDDPEWGRGRSHGGDASRGEEGDGVRLSPWDKRQSIMTEPASVTRAHFSDVIIRLEEQELAYPASHQVARRE